MGDEIPLKGGGRTTVTRGNQVVYREAGPWSVTVISLLRHLETCGFTGAPLIVGTRGSMTAAARRCHLILSALNPLLIIYRAQVVGLHQQFKLNRPIENDLAAIDVCGG
ncbi:hypothetical protein [Rhizobium leguminosarum]|uniref:hypothetical protein n=1 Tax=Rhizobium leguminosarum TaxID=384 RepID=UPI0021BC0511|nr:hypothetical protein [Rhizobium leguminosarum]